MIRLLGKTANSILLAISLQEAKSEPNVKPKGDNMQMLLFPDLPEPEYEVIYVKYITTKRGRKIYAAQKGLKAFRIRVKKKR